jgi:hypothetical protein
MDPACRQPRRKLQDFAGVLQINDPDSAKRAGFIHNDRS